LGKDFALLGGGALFKGETLRLFPITLGKDFALLGESNIKVGGGELAFPLPLFVGRGLPLILTFCANRLGLGEILLFDLFVVILYIVIRLSIINMIKYFIICKNL
jgi:hypothetical protein